MTPDLDALERAAREAEATRHQHVMRPTMRTLVDRENADLRMDALLHGECGRAAAILALIARVRAAEAALGEARAVIEKAEGATQDAYNWASADAQGQSFSARGYQKSVTDFEAKARAWLAQNPQETPDV